MKIRKICQSVPRTKTGSLDEYTWNTEKKNLKKLSRLIFYEIQRLESIFCLEMKNTINFFEEVRQFEINLIKTALFCANGSQRRCAELLGITTSNLNNKIKNYGITPKSLKENTL